MNEVEDYMHIIETISVAVDRSSAHFKPFTVAVIQRALELYEQYIKLFGITTPEDIALYEEVF